jgi:phage terminase Nu1 subunit (DNA packaging protein)
MASKTLAERAETLRPTGLSPLLTTAQLMARYGVSNWTVNEWVKAGCPVEPTAFRGRRFDLDRVREWMAARDQRLTA